MIRLAVVYIACLFSLGLQAAVQLQNPTTTSGMPTDARFEIDFADVDAPPEVLRVDTKDSHRITGIVYPEFTHVGESEVYFSGSGYRVIVADRSVVAVFSIPGRSVGKPGSLRILVRRIDPMKPERTLASYYLDSDGSLQEWDHTTEGLRACLETNAFNREERVNFTLADVAPGTYRIYLAYTSEVVGGLVFLTAANTTVP